MLKISIFAILLSFSAWSNASASSDDDKNLISVTGKAEISVVPDEVHVSLTIKKNDKSLKEAQRQNDEVANKILRVMKNKLRIDEKYIQTNYINVNPVYRYIPCKNNRGVVIPDENNCNINKFSHFETSKGIAVKLKDTDKLQVLLEEAIDAGVTNISNVQFASSKFDELQDKAQIMATKDAKKRAEAIADSIGISIGKPYRINVSKSYNPAPRREMMAMKSASFAADASGETISVGQLTITSNVSAQFIID